MRQKTKGGDWVQRDQGSTDVGAMLGWADNIPIKGGSSWEGAPGATKGAGLGPEIC